MATPRRILQLSHDYEGPFRGICRQYVCAFPDAHVTTLFICGDRSEAVAREVGATRSRFLERPHRAMRGLKLATLRQLHPVFRDGNFDLVIAQRYRPVYFAGILSLVNEIPLIVGVTHEPGVYHSRARRRVIRYGKNIVLAGVSDFVSDDIERDLPGLRASERLYTLPNAIDPSRADDMMTPQAARQALGLPDDRFVFGTVGRLIDKMPPRPDRWLRSLCQ
ncbi:MAG: glycosyltransferase [Gammaproteobacteria bacterium]|nr:glycosyltransferase [Gammaproteobacteria bacterium]